MHGAFEHGTAWPHVVSIPKRDRNRGARLQLRRLCGAALAESRGTQMKRQHIASMVIVSALAFVVSMRLVAQDRFTVKSPNGITFSEFKGYDAWQVIPRARPMPPSDAWRLPRGAGQHG
jgi:hypothetical protein